MNTISHIELHNIWNGKVIIDELKQFKDDRGVLSEIWRTDDDKINSSLSSYISPQMSYWSVTNSLVMRGPHEHKDQCDWFVSWFNRMVFQLYNPATDEMFHFISDPSKVYRIKVDIGIIHSYRNLELRPITTGNFPTSLFMGVRKESQIDEIRHEEKIGDDLKTYVILGANGRLGKALVNYLFKNMNYYMYNVIPIFEKLKDETDVANLFNELIKTNPIICHPEDIVFINCAGMTDVQKLINYTDEVKWANVNLPASLSKHCKRNGCKFYQLSSDYVFRENDNSVYTASKKDMEKKLIETDTCIIRVANLFSLEKNDIHNIICKLKDKAKLNETIMVDTSQYVFPTEVSALAEKIMEFIDDDNDIKEVNFLGEPMTIEEIYKLIGGSKISYIKSPIIFNVNKFLQDSIQVNCKDKILLKIKD